MLVDCVYWMQVFKHTEHAHLHTVRDDPVTGVPPSMVLAPLDSRNLAEQGTCTVSCCVPVLFCHCIASLNSELHICGICFVKMSVAWYCMFDLLIFPLLNAL